MRRLHVFLSLAVLTVAGIYGQIYATSQSQDTEDSKTVLEIKKLISDLGSSSFTIRESATKRLKEIGILALELLEKNALEWDLETKTRAASLAQAIRKTHNLPTRIDGMEFKLCLDQKEWRIPNAQNEENTISFSLRLSNIVNDLKRLSKLGECRPVLTDSNGIDVIKSLGHPMSMRLDQFQKPISKGESFSVDWGGKLGWSEGRPGLACWDIYGNWWGTKELSKGTYRLSVVYGYAGPQQRGEIPLWVGKAETQKETITVK